MNYHTALDVSLRSVSICIIDDEGNIAWSPKPTTETGDYPVGVIVTSPVNPNEYWVKHWDLDVRMCSS